MPPGRPPPPRLCLPSSVPVLPRFHTWIDGATTRLLRPEGGLMSADHLKVQDFERFLRNATEPGTGPRNTRLVRHLLAACAPCQETLRKAASTSPEAYDYGTSFAQAEQSLAAFLAKGRTSDVSAEALLAELAQLPPAEQVERVASDRYAVPSLIKHLIDTSH